MPHRSRQLTESDSMVEQFVLRNWLVWEWQSISWLVKQPEEGRAARETEHWEYGWDKHEWFLLVTQTGIQKREKVTWAKGNSWTSLNDVPFWNQSSELSRIMAREWKLWKTNVVSKHWRIKRREKKCQGLIGNGCLQNRAMPWRRLDA